MTWTLTDNQLTEQSLLTSESLFSLGNGYLGVRGNFEEGYREGMKSIRGTYLNAFHDIVDISYGEKLYAFPETQQKLLNVIDSQTIHIYFGEDQEHFSLFDGEVLSYERKLHFDRGFSERIIHWRSPKGKEVKLAFRRAVSFVKREVFAIDIYIDPVNFSGLVKVVSTVNGDVSNYSEANDPRVASGHSKRLHVKETGFGDAFQYVLNEAQVSKLQTACVSTYHVKGTSYKTNTRKTEKSVETVIVFELTDAVQLTKWNVYTDTLRHEENLVQKAIHIHQTLNMDFEGLLQQQKEYLDDFWDSADITIDGDEKLQEGIRFNLYHLLQSVGKDRFSNISAKGLSGEGYEGHYFWDTEIYIFPVFLMIKPELARQLLIYRNSTLDDARNRAKEMGHTKGALFPWRTISGSECSSFFPAGTAQYHISADVAYSYIQYYLATNDDNFLKQFGAEVLFETARLWMEVGHYQNGKFKIDAVTGPDEYTCIVNNNYYTNVMAKYNLRWAADVYERLHQIDSKKLQELTDRLEVTEAEVCQWKDAARNMYLPYDEKLKMNPQDDTFLQKAIWDFENTPKEHYPLLLHYHPLTLYRYQVCKQADTVLAHFLLEDEQDFDTIKNSYDYYEKITTHDSSLSSCIFSIMASRIGYRKKAYDYFIETARLDLDNTHGNTKDGLHMANMGGTWMSIIFGFAGVRIKETGLSMSPDIPDNWNHYAFSVQYQGRKIKAEISKTGIRLQLVKGDDLKIKLYGKDVTLLSGQLFETDLLLQK
ncbi:family 65 glycosyl hydrolase [Bacillus methanolicus]|uniref:glycoside hydrolase family 65 protein n=1 Tax=Bacillus methanolicus TaxID=1471 RepID=UPI00238021BB|nr:glycosyl hydrolase family 65 protein [Bacillus methanolicus]MDE3837833.1 family 65 glycosyl hydrolase [Bacillus methanolicus]